MQSESIGLVESFVLCSLQVVPVKVLDDDLEKRFDFEAILRNVSLVKFLHDLGDKNTSDVSLPLPEIHINKELSALFSGLTLRSFVGDLPQVLKSLQFL